MKLNKLKNRTYYIDNNCNIGVYDLGGGEVTIIDSGIDKYVAKKIIKLLAESNFLIKYIINTHYHADHMGGNAYIQKETGCTILVSENEKALFEDTFLEPMGLIGGNPTKNYLGKFLMAEPCTCQAFEKVGLPKGLSSINLSGHTQGNVGIITDDGVAFLGDSLFSSDILEKYPVSYMFDPKKQYDTLEALKSLDCDYFVPSHSEVLNNIEGLIEVNESMLDRFISCVQSATSVSQGVDDILNYVFKEFDMEMNKTQYALVISSIRGALTYLIEGKKVDMRVQDNKMCYVNLT